ncbi:MAG: diacylglycerol kinase family protein [Eubacteriales bacterium]|nr:diacylglycerol kinase family protein [Eubacteriales bacterium]
MKQKRLTPQKGNALFLSFSYALQGISAGLRTERNMVIHFAAMSVVVVFGALLRISATEWMICVILFGAVFMAELFNTSIETVVDMICPQRDPRAKLAKDTAAGAVLFMAVAAAIVGCIIFLPKLWVLVLNH